MDDKQHPQIDARTIKMEDLPACPSGCERSYLNLVNYKPLDHNYSPHAVDFVYCSKCDMQAPVRVWQGLPGIYNSGNTTTVVSGVTEEHLVQARDEMLDLCQDFYSSEGELTLKDAEIRVEMAFEYLAEKAEKGTQEPSATKLVPAVEEQLINLRNRFWKLAGLMRAKDMITSKELEDLMENPK